MEAAEAVRLRNRIIGLLVKRARRRAGRGPNECAAQLGCCVEAFIRCEQGQDGFSLPQLEALAHFLDLPTRQLWDADAMPATQPPAGSALKLQVMVLRSRILALKFRQYRRAAGLSQQEVARLLRRSREVILQYEEGEREIPLAELEVLASACGKTTAELMEEAIVTVDPNELDRQELARFRALPQDLRQFVLEAENAPYLRLAMRLSTLKAGELD